MAMTDRHWFPGDSLAIHRLSRREVSPAGSRLAGTVRQAVLSGRQSSFSSQVDFNLAVDSHPVRLNLGAWLQTRQACAD